MIQTTNRKKALGILCCEHFLRFLLKVLSAALCIVLTAFAADTPLLYGERIELKTLDGRMLESYKQSRALVVGIESYDHGPPKTGAVQDAREISWELQRLGFSVTLLTQATAEELHASLEEWIRQNEKQGGGCALFYFAGKSQSTTTGENRKLTWLIPRDAPLPEQDAQGFERNAVSTGQLAVLAGKMSARHVLLLINAPLASNRFEVRPPVLEFITDAQQQPARQFITAGGPLDSGADSQVFKRFLLLGLRGEADLIHDGLISAEELGAYLVNRMSKASGHEQQPAIGRIAGAGDEGGSFLFRPTNRQLPVARLFVDTQPPSAIVRIMNIKPTFAQGMLLDPGRYNLQVSSTGYQTMQKAVQLRAGESCVLNIDLAKIENEITNTLGMRFVRIKPGRFSMGSPTTEKGRASDETRHDVNLTRTIYMLQTEVTVAGFRQFVNATGYRTEAEKSEGCWIANPGHGWSQGRHSYWEKPGTSAPDDRMPVTCVTWNDAMAFARWLSKKEGRTYRLATEAEWEYACRAGTKSPFAFGHCLASREDNFAGVGQAYQRCATVFENRRDRCVAVGSLAPNAWHLHNMHGNVAEWCADWYGPYPAKTVLDPKGPGTGTDRVIRGGRWQSEAAKCRSAHRGRFQPNFASDVVGFRLVMEP